MYIPTLVFKNCLLAYTIIKVGRISSKGSLPYILP